MPFGSIISAGASLLGGALGGGKSELVGQKDPFLTLPKEAQDLWLKSVLPGAESSTTGREFRPLPMKRAEAPTTPFDSQMLYELQKYSDRMGGLFSPLYQGQETRNNAAEQEAASRAMMQSLRDEMMGREFIKSIAGTKGYGGINLQDYSSDELSTLGELTRGRSLNDAAAMAKMTLPNRVKLMEILNKYRLA